MAVPPASAREQTPLFSQDGGDTPFTASFMDALFTAWVGASEGAEAAEEFTFHCCRSTLASSLAVMEKSDEMIQVFCRWRSPASVAEYRHITPDRYADAVAEAVHIDATTRPHRHVVTDDDDAMVALAAETEASGDDGLAALQISLDGADAWEGERTTDDRPDARRSAGMRRALRD